MASLDATAVIVALQSVLTRYLPALAARVLPPAGA